MGQPADIALMVAGISALVGVLSVFVLNPGVFRFPRSWRAFLIAPYVMIWRLYVGTPPLMALERPFLWIARVCLPVSAVAFLLCYLLPGGWPLF